MIVMTVLLVFFAATWLVPPRERWEPRERWRIALALTMIIAGILHFVTPTPFVQHLPEWIPGRLGIIYITGLIEIGLGVALVTTRGRSLMWAGLALAAFLVAVFPGNIYVAISGVEVDGQPGGIYPWLRLPFQLLYISLAWWTTKPRPAQREPSKDRSVMAATH